MGCGRKIGDFPCCEVIRGDSREVLKAIPDGIITFTLTDPPYGVGLGYDNYIDSRKNLAELIPVVMPELLRISPLTMATPGNLSMDLYPQPDWIAAWVCTAGMIHARKNWGFGCWQPILLYGPPNRNVYSDVLNHMEGADETGSFHPCAKPLKLWKKIMVWGIPESKSRITRVLDPFMGSGTTAFAAIELGIHFFGIEQSQKYVDAINERLNKARTNLFTE